MRPRVFRNLGLRKFYLTVFLAASGASALYGLKGFSSVATVPGTASRKARFMVQSNTCATFCPWTDGPALGDTHCGRPPAALKYWRFTVCVRAKGGPCFGLYNESKFSERVRRSSVHSRASLGHRLVCPNHSDPRARIPAFLSMQAQDAYALVHGLRSTQTPSEAS